MTSKAKSIMFLGTGSDVGKSITATAFCRILKRRGYNVAPFKAQNMSNNSYITLEGGEIGRAQVVQAEAAGLQPSSDMNPILLKPSSGMGAQVVVQGKVHSQMRAAEYHSYKKQLVKAVMESYERLAAQYDVIVLEGAGSCCEVNLKKNDLVNFAMARRIDAPCILVADIDRGGVFAQLIGSMSLMTPVEKRLTAGFIINKFRGDPALFEDGIKIIEDKTRKPVFGLTPFYQNIFIDPEDSVAVQTDKRAVRPTETGKINTAVIKLPGISNFTDIEALEREADVLVNYLDQAGDLTQYDLLILPGTKNCMEDAVWLKKTGWASHIKKFASTGKTILGICGGYQLLGREIRDPHHVESDRDIVNALDLLPVSTTLAAEKILRRVTGKDLVSGKKITGYEIHMGLSELIEKKAKRSENGELRPFLSIHEPGSDASWDDGWNMDEGRIIGTYVHGILDSPGWRRDYLNGLRRKKGLSERKRSAPARGGRFHQYDLLADHYERHTDVEAILKAMKL